MAVTNEVYNSRLHAWADALVSGKYKQGRERLKIEMKDNDFNYCCLGVACDIVPKSVGHWGFEDENGENGNCNFKDKLGNYQDNILPEGVWKYYGLEGPSGEEIVALTGRKDADNLFELNDDARTPFYVLAKYIRGFADTRYPVKKDSKYIRDFADTRYPVKKD